MAASKKKTASANPASGARIGRGNRWTDEQVQILMDAVQGASTAKAGFEKAAKQLGKSVGTVQQKYYNAQKKNEGGARRRGRKVAAVAASTPRRVASATSSMPNATELRTIAIDDLVSLAQRVKTEVDRRKQELGVASQLFK